MSSNKTKQNNNKNSKVKTSTVSKKAAKAGQPGNSKRLSQFQRGKHPMYGTSTFFSNTSTVPSAFVNVDTNSTFSRVEGSVHHKKLGLDGIALVGCQPFQNVVTTGSDSQFWVHPSAALATTSSAQIVGISPDSLNGPLAAQANLHSKYFFTDIMIEYVSTVATTQAGAACLALSKNIGQNYAASFSENRQITPSVTFPFRADRVFLHIHSDDSTDLFWTELDEATTAGTRQTYQYILTGWPSASSIGAVTMGYINIWYRVELYGDVQSQGFTSRLRSAEEAKFLNFALGLYRDGNPDKNKKNILILSDDDEKKGDDEDYIDIKPGLLDLIRAHFGGSSSADPFHANPPKSKVPRSMSEKT